MLHVYEIISNGFNTTLPYVSLGGSKCCVSYAGITQEQLDREGRWHEFESGGPKKCSWL